MLETIIVILAVVLDQITKHLTDLYLMPLGTSIPVIDGVLHFTSTHNTGAVFGILAGMRPVFLVLTTAAIAAIIYILIKKRQRLHLFARILLALILAGAIGNYIDRLFLGYVRDMIEARFVNFAIFNVADCCVTVGTLLFMADILFGKSKSLLDDKKPEAVAAPLNASIDQQASEPVSEPNNNAGHDSPAASSPLKDNSPKGMDTGSEALDNDAASKAQNPAHKSRAHD